MDKFAHLSEALLLIAYAIGLWLGESLRSSLFPEGTHRTVFRFVFAFETQAPLSRQISYQFQPRSGFFFPTLFCLSDLISELQHFRLMIATSTVGEFGKLGLATRD